MTAKTNSTPFQTLTFSGERDIVPSIEPLLDHSGAGIREAAEETLYFVDDSGLDEFSPGSGTETEFGADSDSDPGFDSAGGR